MAYPATDSGTISHGSNPVAFRKNLKKVDDGLGSKDVQKLCFLCRDFEDVPQRELDGYKRGLELFRTLQNVDLLMEDDVSLLLELLEAIRRKDLLRKAKQIWPDSLVVKTRLSAYRKMLLDIADNTTSSELLEMKAVADLPYSMEDLGDTLQFLITLEKEAIISRDNVMPLMEYIENRQSIKKIQAYIDNFSHTDMSTQPSPGAHTTAPYSNPNPPAHFNGYHQPVGDTTPYLMKPDDFVSLRQSTEEGGDAASLQKHMEELTVGGKDETEESEELRNENLVVNSDKLLAAGAKGSHDAKQPTIPQTPDSCVSMMFREQEDTNVSGSENLPVQSCMQQPTTDVGDVGVPQDQSAQLHNCEEHTIERRLDRCYKMNANPCGVCVIINNVDFRESRDRGKQLKDRLGSDKDVEALLNCFHKFNFQTIKKDNLTSSQMYTLLNNIRERRVVDTHNAFVCCILTHGKLGKLAGTNGEYLQIREIIGLFASEKCPSLTGKPKMFFLQACQGKEEPDLYEIQKDDDSKPRGIGAGLIETVPNQADILLGYATVPGYVSFRSRTTGSWYINALVDALNVNYKDEDLMSILTIVNKKLSSAIANRKLHDSGQVPAPVSTLRGKVYFQRQEKVVYL